MGLENDVRATGERHADLTGAQALHRQVDGDKGGRAGRVDGYGGAIRSKAYAMRPAEA